MDFIKIKICSTRGTVKSQPDRENGLQPQTLYLSNLYLKPKNNTKTSAVLTGKRSEQTPYEEQTGRPEGAGKTAAPALGETRLPSTVGLRPVSLPAAPGGPRHEPLRRQQVGPESAFKRIFIQITEEGTVR